MRNILEQIVDDINYSNITLWHLPNLTRFSKNKTLFDYQVKALENITKVLYLYYSEFNADKNKLLRKYREYGLDDSKFAIEKYETKSRMRKNKRFEFFKNHFPTVNDEYISVSNFLNRACFWMATGSGKSLVLIKTIELVDYLQKQGLIPQREIMLLLPREDLIKQFKNEIDEYNMFKERPIRLVSLKDYEGDKIQLTMFNEIKVYYYRSDLLRDETKENILDYRNYLNNGNWYIFLDEAHKGSKEDSIFQDYVTVLSKNGFLFNFSATFTDEIDHVTTCYNFNLEKFIKAGYGKNIYLSQSYFSFKDDKDDFNEEEKQKQVLKSLIVFSLVKKAKKEGTYHHPLLITLVNSVNTDDSDLLLFFKKLEEIAIGKINEDLFGEAKEEILRELKNHRTYVFGEEQLQFDIEILEKLSKKDLLECVFNAQNHGKIEILEGEKGKEIILKLETSDKPFALIRIGDAKKFQREKLGNNYVYISSYDEKKVFENINNLKDINLLLGSRSFYEGWDSNRPNVINLINIGKQDAKKFVLQAIGRGIRIEPHKGERKRLPQNYKDKNALLETLFIFATDKDAVKAIIETVEEQKDREEVEISLYENQNRTFDLLIPVYKEEENRREDIARFNIAEESLVKFRQFISSFGKNVLLLKTNLSLEQLNFLLEKVTRDDFFQIKNEKVYNDMDFLLKKLSSHVSVKNKVVSEVKELEDEIIHFKHVKVVNMSDEEIEALKEKIEKVRRFEVINESEIDALLDEGKITKEEYKKMIKSLVNTKPEETFKDLKIKKVAQHYYLPVIYSTQEKIDYIKHIIKVPSEVKFIENLEEYVKKNSLDVEWMFSKIDERLDKKMGIPYFCRKENSYREFFPDFIFWIKKGKNYKIVFVDPKGTSNADYQNKVDEFERLFYENGKPKVFTYRDFDITFDLKLVAEDINSVSAKYQKYWLAENDFSFLRI
ncbi:DEAD/DEAH box helicase family protein [Caldicellulosiruptor acetigenus]|uniref:DEAD/DEAH box helicase family protein n=1 Tax=Caldicellulosiruptor acetigenus TaxID=301953 RepID=UPI0004097860|nr:DEAD/DEAH box helicase family protein [Caldicellulosiruptor acetigenus]WAM36916.1 DEAD/DEAH box helicase family protein [Caldicellulosiruptor acetigenus]